MTPEQAAEAAVPYIYYPDTPRRYIEEDLAMRRPWFPKPEAYLAQLQGIFSWESYERLSQIRSPTLVIHGESDRLVPAANGKIISDRIPGAKLILLAHASHIFTTDQPEAAHQAILEFLQGQHGECASTQGS
jgi:pimeloyl-ACP methyl ester carboxylesterase